MRINFNPRRALLILVGIVFALYVLFQARYLILGPEIWINSPADGAVVHEAVLNIEGEAKNVAWLRLNGRQIFTDEEGHWSEKLIVAQGLSIMTVTARDRFGRTVTKTVRIILN